MKTKLISAETDVLVGEIIGKKVKITNSSRPELVGVKGTIVDETMKTVTLDIGKKEIKITKSHNEFDFDGTVIDGKKLEFRPHERLKKYWKKM